MKFLCLFAVPLLWASCDRNPTPQPPEVIGYDCDSQPQHKGLVKVADALADRYIVVFKQRPLTQRLYAAQTGVYEVRTLDRGYAARISAQAVKRMVADSLRPGSEIAYVQMDGVKKVSPLPAAETPAWNLDRIDQRDLPLDRQYAPNATGLGINVAVIDTGISPHPDFAGRLQLECFSAHGSCEDGHGHGTHVAGTVGGETWGVAKKVQLYPVRVLNSSGSGSDSDVILGIEWVTAQAKADITQRWVINMSLGGGASPALDQATCRAIDAGVVVVAAAGNESAPASDSSPARVRQAVTIGAMGRLDRQASFSNYGPLLDVWMPGVDIQSTSNRGGTETMSGTSMAAPAAAGLAALVLQRHPEFTPKQVSDWIVTHATLGKVDAVPAGTTQSIGYVKEE